jgi:hypothetical protein
VPPISHPYTSARQQQPPPAPVLGRGGFQPFLGAAGLSIGLNTAGANQARRLSAEVHLPRQPRLQPRRSQASSGSSARRPRGPAVHSPSLPPPSANQQAIGSCQSVINGIASVKVKVKVYPAYEQSVSIIQANVTFTFTNLSA